MLSRKLLTGWRPALLAGLVAALVSSLHARTLLVDFGPNNTTDGNVTPSGTPVINPGNGSTGVADSNGNFWNNVVGAGATGGPVAMSYLNLIDTSNAPTGIGLTLGPNWKSNGILNGGLLAPDSATLGSFAIAKATQDYLFIDGGNGNYATLNINNLDPGKLYNLRLFGTRNTTDVRKTTYTVTGGNGIFSTLLQTSGTDIGGAGIHGNNSTIATLSGLQTDASGQLSLRVTATEGGFAYLGILELSEGDAAPAIVTKKVRVDFGRHDVTNGNPTVNPDSFGSYWNSFGTTANGSAISNLVTTTNEPTSLGITLTSANWQNNGINNGGLLAPSSALLGDLAVPTATQDYFFNNGATAVSNLTIRGLSPTKLYSMRFFGTRNDPSIRRSTYTITAGNGITAGTLQTTGPGIGNTTNPVATYNGNNRSTVALGNIQANSTGEVNLALSVAQGDFAYLGILEIVESLSVPALPPVAINNDVDRWTYQDSLDPVAPGGVLFVGSSSIRRWENLTKDFADYRIVQRGFGGSQFSDLNPIVHRIVTPYQASAIVVFEGTNDIRVGNKTGELVFADFKSFVTTVRAQQPNVPICYIGITPVPSFFVDPNHDPRRRTANTLIKDYCNSDPNLKLHFFNTNEFLDNLHDTDPVEWNTYFVDDTHMNRKGYNHFTSVIRPALQAILAPNKVVTANPNALVAGEKLFFDFGPSDVTTGDPTVGADARGNFWNNWYLTNGGITINAGEHLPNLVRSTGTNTGIRMTMSGGFLCNGKAPFGGLFAPQQGLLGELATETATQDFFYSTANDINDATSDDVPGGFMMEGLNPALSYEFRFLGARNNTQTRTTKYDVYGSNSGTANLTTSGTAIGSTGADINDDEAAVISGIRPDAFGQVWVDLTLVQGDFAYINAMQITASTPPVTGTPVENWRSAHFSAEELNNPALEASVWGNDADPDGDGRSNLMEYANGSDPRVQDFEAQDFALETTGDGDVLTLRYKKNLAATDLSFQVQSTDALDGWDDVPDTLVSTDAGIETRKASVSRTGFPQRWLRLKVALVSAN
ncbi:GDSL-type esterase/lipase family protein [Haloferula sp. BvORR071]|uniref:GDSL-type esterase/lipase family protein n=1 Tax=Haloferula sp. BvORR071 TaxID=1396141 RepID=UPI00069655BD|nr:GDSL-type esterase/lipase family protein [Haloferula sp. BvORR071]